ncbi:hypothetical protein OC845_005789 [Tilletia horrida]|nr:hypothetical protein OC845_005789 [Tilletia horrida]
MYGLVYDNVPLRAGAIITLPAGAPATTLPDISFTASGASGSTAVIGIADLAGTASFYTSSNDELFGPLPFTCAALSPVPPVLPYDMA